MGFLWSEIQENQAAKTMMQILNHEIGGECNSMEIDNFQVCKTSNIKLQFPNFHDRKMRHSNNVIVLFPNIRSL